MGHLPCSNNDEEFDGDQLVLQKAFFKNTIGYQKGYHIFCTIPKKLVTSNSQ